MRADGVSNFPDPTGGGGIQLPAGINPASPAFKSAQSKCRHLYLPGGGPSTAPPSAKAKLAAPQTSEVRAAHGVTGSPIRRTRPPPTRTDTARSTIAAESCFAVPRRIDVQSPSTRRPRPAHSLKPRPVHVAEALCKPVRRERVRCRSARCCPERSSRSRSRSTTPSSRGCAVARRASAARAARHRRRTITDARLFGGLTPRDERIHPIQPSTASSLACCSTTNGPSGLCPSSRSPPALGQRTRRYCVETRRSNSSKGSNHD